MHAPAIGIGLVAATDLGTSDGSADRDLHDPVVAPGAFSSGLECG
jgi:hypothetical protein